MNAQNKFPPLFDPVKKSPQEKSWKQRCSSLALETELITPFSGHGFNVESGLDGQFLLLGGHVLDCSSLTSFSLVFQDCLQPWSSLLCTLHPGGSAARWPGRDGLLRVSAGQPHQQAHQDHANAAAGVDEQETPPR